MSGKWVKREIGPSLRAPSPLEGPGKIAGRMGRGRRAAGILSGRTRKSGHCFCPHPSSWGAAGRFEASVIEERRKGAEDLLRFTVHIPALNNSPQLKEFFRVCAPARSPPQHLGSLLPTRLHPVTPQRWSLSPAGRGGDTALRGVQGPAHPATPSDPHTPA